MLHDVFSVTKTHYVHNRFIMNPFNNFESFNHDSYSDNAEYIDDKPSQGRSTPFALIFVVFIGFFLAGLLPFIFVFANMNHSFPIFFLPVIITTIPFLGLIIFIFSSIFKKSKEYISFDGYRMVLSLHQNKRVKEFHLDPSYEVDIATIIRDYRAGFIFVLRQNNREVLTHFMHMMTPSFSSMRNMNFNANPNMQIMRWQETLVKHGIKVNLSTASSPFTQANNFAKQNFNFNNNQETKPQTEERKPEPHQYESTYQMSYQMKADAELVRSHNRKKFGLTLIILILLATGIDLSIFFFGIYGQNISQTFLVLFIILMSVVALIPLVYGIVMGISNKQVNSLSDKELTELSSSKKFLSKHKNQ